MKRFLALALVFALIGLGVPAQAFAAGRQQAAGTIAGAVKDQGGLPVANHTVRVRNAGNGELAGTGRTTAAGEFSFANLGQGTYVVEVVDGTGRVLATSTSIALTTGAMTISGVAIALTESDKAAAAAAAAGGASFFKSTTGIILLASAAALAVGGIVVATNDDTPKSPSK